VTNGRCEPGDHGNSVKALPVSLPGRALLSRSPTGRRVTLWPKVGIVLAVFVLVEAGCFAVGSAGLMVRFWPYHCLECAPSEAPVGALPLSRDYFTASERRGVDIAPSRPVTSHQMNDHAYPIWSNELGCFDAPSDGVSEYIYLAGDSFAWGYAPWTRTIGARLERLVDTRVLKCAVPHTGQIHQFDKMREIVDRLGIPPTTLIVAFTPNDIANDFTHPHTVVVNGYLVDQVHLFLGNGAWVPRWTPLDELEHEVRKREPAKAPLSTGERLAFEVSKVSLSVSVAFNAWKARTTPPIRWDPSLGMPIYVRELWERSGHLWYSGSPYVLRNRAALRDFAEFSRRSGARLLLVLIPELSHAQQPGYFRELLAYADSLGVETLDLGREFARRHLDASALYNFGDPHLNSRGHQAVAEAIAASLRR